MSHTPSATDLQLPFRATLRPHRSLSRGGFVVVMALVSMVGCIAGAAFFVAGAWPVTFFFGLDVALIYFAFKLNFRDGRRYETIEISHDAVVLTRCDPNGRCRHKTYNPAWVVAELNERPNGRNEIALRLRSDRTSFGMFLTDEERRDLASTLRQALILARGARI